MHGIESVWALRGRVYKGVYHHWSVKRCHRFVDEFTFGIEQRGRYRIGTLDFLGALGKGAIGKRLTCALPTKG